MKFYKNKNKMRVIDLNINQEVKKIEGKELNPFFKLEIPIDI
jgi:hypothetical protein